MDKAESEPELAEAINGVAPGVFGEEAAKFGALVVHYSTDYVYDGRKAGWQLEDDAPGTHLVSESEDQAQRVRRPYLKALKSI